MEFSNELFSVMGKELTDAIVSRFSEDNVAEHIQSIFKVMDRDPNLRNSTEGQIFVFSALSRLSCPPDEAAYADAYRDLLVISAACLATGELNKANLARAVRYAVDRGCRINENRINSTLIKVTNIVDILREFTKGQLICSDIKKLSYRFRDERALVSISEEYDCLFQLTDKVIESKDLETFMNFYAIPDHKKKVSGILFDALVKTGPNALPATSRRNMDEFVDCMMLIEKKTDDEALKDEILELFAGRVADGSLLPNFRTYGGKTILDAIRRSDDPLVFREAMLVADPNEYLEAVYLDAVYDGRRGDYETMKAGLAEGSTTPSAFLTEANRLIQYALDRIDRIIDDNYIYNSSVDHIRTIYAILMSGLNQLDFEIGGEDLSVFNTIQNKLRSISLAV